MLCVCSVVAAVVSVVVATVASVVGTVSTGSSILHPENISAVMDAMSAQVVIFLIFMVPIISGLKVACSSDFEVLNRVVSI